MHKILTALATAAALTLAVVAVPDQADARWRGGHRGYGGGGVAAGIIGGLAAGAILGGIAADQGYYGPGYYGGPVYAPGYYYGAEPYAYDPGPVYVRPMPRYRGGGGCWVVTDSARGYGYYGPCN
jgi:MFS family permease